MRNRVGGDGWWKCLPWVNNGKYLVGENTDQMQNRAENEK
jgi:hypothetical protein